MQEFVKPLNDVITKAHKLTEGRKPEYFNHLKTIADSLTALAWIAFLGKDCGQCHITLFYNLIQVPSPEFCYHIYLLWHRNLNPIPISFCSVILGLNSLIGAQLSLESNFRQIFCQKPLLGPHCLGYISAVDLSDSFSTIKGMSFPTAHVEECWQMAEFYNNKVLYLLDNLIIIYVVPVAHFDP